MNDNHLKFAYQEQRRYHSAYIDGVQQSQRSSCPPEFDATTRWTLTLGNFDGDIDEVRISKTLR